MGVHAVVGSYCGNNFDVRIMTINYRGLTIPKVSFGNVTSDDLFCEKEQAIFDFYEANKDRYRRALDIGANIGVHSMLLARAGFDVRAYEPDPETYSIGRANVMRGNDGWHGFNGITFIKSAVSDHDGTETFVRVKGNTTGSHLKGDKQPYGELEEFEVAVVDCRPLFDWCNFAKIDCEGHEARLLLTVTPEQAAKTDFMVEVGNAANAEAICRHFDILPTKLWAQKHDWRQVQGIADMPTHHSEGALFIGREPPFREKP